MTKKMSVLFLSALLILSLSACSKDKEDAKKKDTPTEQTKGVETGKNLEPVVKTEAEQASELVLATTKVVQVFSMNQRINENYKELGPFYVVRGVDEKGRIAEVWVREGKIYEIN